LLEKEYTVDTLFFNNHERIDLFDFISFIFGRNFKSDKQIINKIKKFEPDVVYIHNIWFKVGFGVFRIFKKENIKVLLKIHNFRFYCSKPLLIKNHIKEGNFCFACSNVKSRFNIFNKYFENSYLKSFFSILFSKRYFKILTHHPLQIAVINNFYKNQLKSFGIDPNKIFLFQNSLIKENYLEPNYNPESKFVVYAGRIEESKGLEELLNAWKNAETQDLTLKIIGEGSIKRNLVEKYKMKNLVFCGELSLEDTLYEISKSRAVITATKMYEGQPRILTEASVYKIPSIYPSFGGMDELFPKDYPLKFTQFDQDSLVEKINLLQDVKLLEESSILVEKHINTIISEKKLLNEFNQIIINE